MSQNILQATRTLMTLTGANTKFDALVDSIMARLRLALGVPPADSEDADLEAERELAQLKNRLRAFYPEYEALCHELLLKYLGPHVLVAVVPLLDGDDVRQYLKAMQLMEPELTERVALLTRRMGNTPMCPASP